jgi:hypothetical protein
MKKIALLIALMTVCALTTYAQIAVTVTGSSELTFGVDLDDPLATGFTNANVSNISFTLVSGSAEKGAEEAVYGWIKVTGMTIDMNTGDGDTALVYNAGSTEAKIIFPGGWVKISGYNSGLDFIDNVQDADGVAAVAPAVTNNGGFTVGIDGAFAVEISLFSFTDWTADNNYGAHVKATLTAAPVTVAVAACMGLVENPTIGVGAKLTLAAAPINLWAGVDLDLTEGAANMYEIGAGLTFTVVADMTIAASMSMDEVYGLDAKVVVTEGDGDKGIVPVVGMGITLGLYNLLDDPAVWTLDVTANAAIPKGKIFAEFGMGSDEIVNLTVGVEMGLITNVTNTLKYVSTQLSPEPVDAGQILFITKISL